MKLIKPGKFTTTVITCPKCCAVLEIDARDVNSLYLNTMYVMCCECETPIFVIKNSDDTYYIPVGNDGKACKKLQTYF